MSKRRLDVNIGCGRGLLGFFAGIALVVLAVGIIVCVLFALLLH